MGYQLSAFRHRLITNRNDASTWHPFRMRMAVGHGPVVSLRSTTGLQASGLPDLPTANSRQPSKQPIADSR
jgi:hypothetical protein